jgi:hypothetical protein
MYQQREAPETTEPVGLWEPEIKRADDTVVEFVPSEADEYVVLDEIMGDQVRLAVTTWPRVDEEGRLRFAESGSEPLPVDRADLQRSVDRLREAEGQLVRPLRIGDVFLLRGMSPDPEEWKRLLDITGAARRAASRAGVRVVAQPVDGTQVTVRIEDAAIAEHVPVPSWRRPPERPGATPSPRPPAEPTLGSVTSPAV